MQTTTDEMEMEVILTTGDVSVNFKAARVIRLLKEPSSGVDCLTSYRPISTRIVLFKVMGKMVSSSSACNIIPVDGSELVSTQKGQYYRISTAENPD